MRFPLVNAVELELSQPKQIGPTSHHIKIKLKTDHNLKVRAKPIKVLGENFGVNFHGFGLGIALTPKEKNKLDFTKVKKPVASNDPMEKVKTSYRIEGNIYKLYA